MRLILFFLFIASSAFANDATLINGKPIDKSIWPDVINIRRGFGSCSATIVSKRVILTAAHCIRSENDDKVRANVNGRWIKANCRQHPEYVERQMDEDIALCYTNEDMNVSSYGYIAQEREYPSIGEEVILIGYGCLRKDPPRGGNDGILRIGSAEVNRLPNDDRYSWYDTILKSPEQSALCFGDSGGPSFKMIQNPKEEKHLIYGVNSRGDIVKRSMLQAFTSKAYDFIESWQNEFGYKICGYSQKCLDGDNGGGNDDDNGDGDNEPKPRPEPSKCDKYKSKMEGYKAKLDEYQAKLESCRFFPLCFAYKKKAEKYLKKYETYRRRYESCQS